MQREREDKDEKRRIQEMEEKAMSVKEQREIKLRDEIDFCLCKFETNVDSFPISQLGLVEDIRLYVGKVSDFMASYHYLTIKLKSIVETGDIGYQQYLDQGVDHIQSGNNKIEAKLKDADIAELNRVEREKEELARKREEEECASRKKEELICERLIEA